jgi:hypothetical protein
LVGGATVRGLAPIPIMPKGVFSHPSRLTLQCGSNRQRALRRSA